MHKGWLFWLLTAPLAASPFDSPDVHYQESRQYYQVTADSWPALLAAVRSRPGKGNHAWAQTAWQVKYQLAFMSRPGECRIAAVKARVKVTFTLPRWQNIGQQSTALQNRWHGFYAHLIEHEYQHRRHVVTMVKTLRQQLLALPAGSDCQSLKARFVVLRDQSMATRARQDQALDERDKLWQQAEMARHQDR